MFDNSIDSGFNVQGFDDLLSALKQMQAKLPVVGSAFVEKVTEHAAWRSKVNAPIRTGELRLTLVAMPVVLVNGVASGGIVYPEDYALKMHENLVPYGNPVGISKVTGKPIYSKGPISMLQAATPEGGVGGKYIERVMQYHSQSYFKALENGLNTYFGTGFPVFNIDTPP